MTGGIAVTIGFLGLAISWPKLKQRNLTNKYMYEPVVLRPGDPKIARINNYCDLDEN